MRVLVRQTLLAELPVRVRRWPTKQKRLLLGVVFCLSKSQTWYIITEQGEVYIIKGGLPPLYLITLIECISYDLMICNTLC